MKSFNMKKICTVLCAALFSTTMFADGDADFNTSLLISQTANSNKTTTTKSKGTSTKNTVRNPNTWKPYYVKTKDVEPKTSFYQQTLGVGFLYFSGIKGNLQPTNNSSFRKVNQKLNGHLSYNRTPIAEYNLGTDIFTWMKMALSYQHQGGVQLQTKPQAANLLTGSAVQAPADLTTNLSFDTFMLKFVFTLPYTMVWKNIYYEPYLGAAVGPGWITATDIKVISRFTTTLRQKVSANCAYSIDLGFKLRKALPSYILSFVLGCKYNQWGQIRDIGKHTQQYASSTSPVSGNNSQKAALSSPFGVRVVYQFAPYVGVAFSF